MNVKSELRIRGILDAAINEFVEKGYDLSSMESIAARAKLSKGGLYHHFKSKAEILFAVNIILNEPIQKFMEEVVRSKSIEMGLKHYVANYLNYWQGHQRELKLYFLTMNEAFANHQIMKLYKDGTKQIFDFFEMQFQQGQNTGVFVKHNARAHAVAMISCLDGYCGYLLIEPAVPIKQIITQIQKVFIVDIKRK
jgi:AcrR family transcriptional regulator